MRNEGDMGSRGDEGLTTRREGASAKTVIAIAAAVLVGIFALQNLEDADVNFLLWDSAVPVSVVIAISAGLGFVVGWLLGRASGKRRAIEKIVD